MDSKPTPKEALIAEMLGDVLKLHDAVEQLKTDIPAALKPLTDLNARLEKSHANLEVATAAAQKESEAVISALVAKSKAEIDSHTQAMLKSVANHIAESTQIAITSAVKDLKVIVETEIKAGLEHASTANETFKKSGREFEATVDKANTQLKQSVLTYDKELQRSVERHKSEGWSFSRFMAFTLIGFVWSLIVALVIVTLYSTGTLTTQQAEQPQSQKHAQR
jgi:DNA anti-recombination protein RmuC